MTALLADACLGLVVLAAWIGCFGVIRMGSALDRLHAVTFVNAAAGVPLALAGLLADGLSARSVKLVALVVFVLATGAAVSHAAGRALLLRDGPQA